MTQISMDTSFYVSFILVMVGGLIILSMGLFLRAHSLPWKGEKRDPNELIEFIKGG